MRLGFGGLRREAERMWRERQPRRSELGRGASTGGTHGGMRHMAPPPARDRRRLGGTGKNDLAWAPKTLASLPPRCFFGV